jgi:hypothetical protein
MHAPLVVDTRALDSVAVGAVLSNAIGVEPATAAVISTSDAPRISARIGVYRSADIAVRFI